LKRLKSTELTLHNMPVKPILITVPRFAIIITANSFTVPWLVAMLNIDNRHHEQS
jgi:hypothetical protein